MKQKITIIILGIMSLFPLLHAQHRVYHLSELPNAETLVDYADVEGYLLIDNGNTLPVQHSVFRDGITVMEGWPVEKQGSTNRGGVYANLDDDPELEILYNIGTKTYAWNPDGTDVAGWPVTVGQSPQYGAPAYGDIDGDGYDEVVVSTRLTSTGKIHAFEKDGTIVTGFPVVCDGAPTRTPVLADLDGDGAMEIIVELRKYPDGLVCVYHGDGTIMEGWPAMMDYIPASSVAVGDINGDGSPEIIAESYYLIWAFTNSGDTLDGFPYEPGNDRVFSYSSPVIADLNGFGSPVILVGDHSLGVGNGAVHIIKSDGTALEGWPKYTISWIYGPPAVADIDGDGSLDIAVGDQVLSATPSDKLYAWDKYGNYLPGFPVSPIWAINNQIIIADLDGDNMMELMFDDNTGSNIYNGYNHDGTMMDNWPLHIDGSSFFINPMVLDVNGDGTLNISGGGHDLNLDKTWIYLWDAGVPFTEESAPLSILQYNVRHTGVYGEKGNPVVEIPHQELPRCLSAVCFPNPCKESTTVSFFSGEASSVSLKIFDAKGVTVNVTNYGVVQKGDHQIKINTSVLNAGVYFLQLTTDNLPGEITKLVVEK